MDLGDFLSKAGNAALKAAQNKNADLERRVEKFEHYDDDTLFEMYKGHRGWVNNDDRIAIAHILHERGYGN